MSNPVSAQTMEKITALHQWTLSPTNGVGGLKDLLKTFGNDELIYTTVIFRSGEPAGRIAWVEYASRQKYFDFEIRISEVSPNQLKLVLEAESEAVHTTPKLELKVTS